MPYLLDTNVAIHLRDGDPEMQARLGTMDEMPSISVLTQVELEGGVHARPELADKRRRAVDVLLRNFAVIDFTVDLAQHYAQIIAQAGFSRRKVIDRMIAATALAHDMVLITCNPKDFRDIQGLTIEEW